MPNSISMMTDFLLFMLHLPHCNLFCKGLVFGRVLAVFCLIWGCHRHSSITQNVVLVSSGRVSSTCVWIQAREQTPCNGLQTSMKLSLQMCSGYTARKSFLAVLPAPSLQRDQ